MTISNDLLIIIAVAAVAIVVLIVMVTRPARKTDVRSLYTEGLDHLLRGNIKRAYQCFKGVIDKDTDHNSAYLKLGQVMREGGAADRALQLHESLLPRTNLSTYEKVELYKNLAIDSFNLGRLDDAIRWSLGLLKIDKRNTWAHRHLVRFYRDSGEWDAVGKYLVQWQKLRGKSDTRLQAFCRFRQGFDVRLTGKPETIRNSYRQSLKVDSQFAPAHYFLGESYAREAAELAPSTAVEDPTDTTTMTNLKGGSYEEAAVLYTKAVGAWTSFVDLSPQDTYRVLPRVEDALFFLQRFDDVEPFLKQVLDKDSDNLDAIASLANFYVRRGDLDRAGEVLRRIPENEANRPLIQAIQLKLKYRRNSEANIMPALDRLVDEIRVQTKLDTDNGGEDNLMLWLEPGNDPLDSLG